jgi:hypothetical protein
MRLSVLHPLAFSRGGSSAEARKGEGGKRKGKAGLGIPPPGKDNLCLEGTMTRQRQHGDPKNPDWLAHYHAPENAAAAQADFQRRLRAAGIDPDAEPPEDMDAFRYALARKIVMHLNDWPGCPEKICRRMRGCMAPGGNCTNHADDPPMTREEWDEVRPKIRKALDEHFERLGGIDAVEARLEAERTAREAKQGTK